MKGTSAVKKLFMSLLPAFDLQDRSIGIIGGADGPTSVFLAGSPAPGSAALAAVGILLAAAVIVLLKRKR